MCNLQDDSLSLYSIPVFGTSICQCILSNFFIAIGYFISCSLPCVMTMWRDI